MKELAVFITLLLGLAAPALAQTPPDRTLELEGRIDALAREVERLKLGDAAAAPRADAMAMGYAPAASKVYRSEENRVSIGGYGEMTYRNASGGRQDGSASGVHDMADMLRSILYVGYKFNDWILFNSEIEFEHGTTGNGRGEVSVEAAYLDFVFAEAFGVRGGTLLVPMGPTNEIHEPTTFHGVLRPSVERNIIPSTWRENGLGVFGEAGILSYRSYVMAGLQAVDKSGVKGFSGATGLRGGRSSAALSYAEDLAWVTRVDLAPAEGVRFGLSGYRGQADQGLAGAGSDITVSLGEAHLQAEFRGAEFKALYARGRIGNAAAVNAAQGYTGPAGNSVGSELYGGYLEAAFNVLSLTGTSHYLAPFLRYERYDTQWRTPAGFARNPANNRTEYTFGLTYKPIPQVAVKTDYQWNRNKARTGVSQFNLGLAYIF